MDRCSRRYFVISIHSRLYFRETKPFVEMHLSCQRITSWLHKQPICTRFNDTQYHRHKVIQL